MDDNKEREEILENSTLDEPIAEPTPDFESENIASEKTEEMPLPKAKKKFRFIHVVLILFAVLLIAAGTVAFLF